MQRLLEKVEDEAVALLEECLPGCLRLWFWFPGPHNRCGSAGTQKVDQGQPRIHETLSQNSKLIKEKKPNCLKCSIFKILIIYLFIYFSVQVLRLHVCLHYRRGHQILI